jgi:ABC-type Fe3+ transport system substrate-binding protein
LGEPAAAKLLLDFAFSFDGQHLIFAHEFIATGD